MKSGVMKETPSGKLLLIPILVATVINMLDGFDILVIVFTGPKIAAEWGLEPSQLGILFSSGLAGMVIGSLVIAPFADRIGRRKIVLLCLTIMSCGMFLSSWSHNLAELVSLRVITGLGIGGMLASLNTVVNEYSSGNQKGFAVSLFSIGYPIGATIGGFVTIYLMGEFGWRSVFIFGGAIGLLMIPVVYALMPESIEFLLIKRSPDALRKINLLRQRMGDPELEQLPEALARPKNSVGLRGLFSPALMRSTLMICACYFGVMMTFYFILNWTPKVFVDLGMSINTGISAMLILNISGMAGGLFVGWLSRRWDIRLVSFAATSLFFICVICFSLIPANLLLLVLISALTGFVMSGVMTTLYATVPMIYPAEVRATGTGVAISVGRLGATLGPAVAGGLMAFGWDRPLYYFCLALPLLIAAVLIRRIPLVKAPL